VFGPRIEPVDTSLNFTRIAMHDFHLPLKAHLLPVAVLRPVPQPTASGGTRR